MSVIEFSSVETWEANRAAEAWLDARGFSVGPSQVDGPRAIWHGDCVISKWRNLSEQEKYAVHAVMEGDIREGPVRIRLMPGATAQARAAFALSDAEVANKGDRAATDAGAPLTRCAAGRDGECGHAQCPQLRDKEPAASGRHCPLDNHNED